MNVCEYLSFMSNLLFHLLLSLSFSSGIKILLLLHAANMFDMNNHFISEQQFLSYKQISFYKLDSLLYAICIKFFILTLTQLFLLIAFDLGPECLSISCVSRGSEKPATSTRNAVSTTE